MVNSFDKILYIQYSSIEMPSSVVEPGPSGAALLGWGWSRSRKNRGMIRLKL